MRWKEGWSMNTSGALSRTRVEDFDPCSALFENNSFRKHSIFQRYLKCHSLTTTQHSQSKQPMMRFSSVFLPFMAVTFLLSAVVFSGQPNDCYLCPNGSLEYNHGKIVPDYNATCRSLEFLALITGGDYCTDVRRQASWCECPHIEPGCVFCPAGTEPINPNMTVMNSETTCGKLNYLAHSAIPNETTCDLYQGFRDLCGGCTAAATTTTSAPPPTVTDMSRACSSLCPNGEPVPFPNNLLFEDDPRTCGQLEAEIRFNNTYKLCAMAHYIGISECGCNDTLPPIPEDALCYICEDGSIPVELDLEILPGVTCRGLGYSHAMENETCAVVQATVGAYCGCENPIAESEENVCRICGGDSLLPDPTRMVDLLTTDVSCLDLEYQANDENMTCMDAQNTWADICCPTQAPTDTPSSEPSVSPSWHPSMQPSMMPSDLPSASLAPSQTFESALIASGSVKTCGWLSIGLFVGVSLLLAQ